MNPLIQRLHHLQLYIQIYFYICVRERERERDRERQREREMDHGGGVGENKRVSRQQESLEQRDDQSFLHLQVFAVWPGFCLQNSIFCILKY